MVDCVARGNYDCTRSGSCVLPDGLLDEDPTRLFEDTREPVVGEGFYYLARANGSAACGGSTSDGPGASPALDLVCP